jgi:peptide deformylase
MAIFEILQFPNPLLKKKSQPIQKIDQNIRQLAEDIAETMYAAPGVGLAAPQVGHLLRLIVLDISPANQPKNLQVLVNPEIVDAEGECTWEEGCLSVPEYYEEVKRNKKVVVRYMNLDGEHLESATDGFLSIVLQHEIDHLEGILFIDHLSKLKRDLLRRKLQKENKKEKKL